MRRSASLLQQNDHKGLLILVAVHQDRKHETPLVCALTSTKTMLPASCVLPSATLRMANDLRRILGVSKVIYDNRNCPICLDEFDEPKCLPCAHSFCLECLEKTVDSSMIRCPLCQKESELPNGTVAELPINPVLVQLLDSSPGGKAKQRVREKLNKCREEVETCCNDRYQAFKQESEAIRENSDQKQREIHEAATRLIEAIKRQEENLCAEVDDFVERQEEIMRKKWTSIESFQGIFHKEANRIEETMKAQDKNTVRKQKHILIRQLKEAKSNCTKQVAVEGEFQVCRAKFVAWEDVTSKILDKSFGSLTVDTDKKGVKKAFETLRNRLPLRDSFTGFRSVSKPEGLDLSKDLASTSSN